MQKQRNDESFAQFPTATVSSCKTPFFGSTSMGRDSFLAWDPTLDTLVASACIDAACASAIPVGFLNPQTCAFNPVASLPAFGPVSSSYESAAYNSDTKQASAVRVLDSVSG